MENVDNLQTLISNADEGTTFFFSENVQLSNTITVNTPGLSFQGNADLRPQLSCSEGTDAFLVR